MVIPAHLADAVAAEAVEMTAFEDFATEEVLEGPLHHGPLPRDRGEDAHGFRRLAQEQRPLTSPRHIPVNQQHGVARP